MYCGYVYGNFGGNCDIDSFLVLLTHPGYFKSPYFKNSPLFKERGILK
jgi:hypothetical protein